MNLHPLLIAYGQRRGYDMVDLVSSNLVSAFGNGSSDSGRNFKNASDLTLNLVEPSTYLNELHLFVSFYNALPISHRRCLRPYADGIIAFLNRKLLSLGQSIDILRPVVEEFIFPNENDCKFAGGDSNIDVKQTVNDFLSRFQLPYIREYFSLETDILSTLSSGHSDDNAAIITNRSTNEVSDGEGSETETDTSDPPAWWKKGPAVELQHADIEEEPDHEMDALLDKIRDVCSKLKEREETSESSFTYPVKIYNFAANNTGYGRGNPRPAAVCADLTSNGEFACFGCDGDSSVRCFRLRRLSSIQENNSADLSTVIRISSTANVIYRVRVLNDKLNGPYVLTASNDTSSPVQLFNMATSTKIYDYRGHQWPVWALDTVDNGGGMFLTGSYDSTARLFLLDRKDPIRIFVGHQTTVDCVKIIRNGACDTDYPPYISTASSDRTVRLWSLKDAVVVRLFHGIKGLPTALTYRSVSPNGCSEQLLACATTEGKIVIWEINTGRIYQILEGVLANDLEFSPDGRYLFAVGDHGSFKVYVFEPSHGEFGNQYVEIQISEANPLSTVDSKFITVRFIDEEVICLAT